MYNRKFRIVFGLFFSLMIVSVLSFSLSDNAVTYTGETYVHEVLVDLGMPKPSYYPEKISEEDIQRGKEIVFNGFTDDLQGKRSKYVSIYYVCTNCHNTVKEDPSLTIADPEARLSYAVENKLPFLQGTTFFGTANRETWYSDDYYKKYGDLVKPANSDIREAIQLCAIECSKGRSLEKWEIDAILAYFYSISYRLKDIMNESEIEILNQQRSNVSKQPDLITSIKSKYALKSPATFVEPPYNQGDTLVQLNVKNGEALYKLSCQSCHKPYGCSDVVFDDSKFTFNKFINNFDKNYWWLFEAVRHGFAGYAGHEPYMPHFTAERMSDQQVMDLKAYFYEQAQN